MGGNPGRSMREAQRPSPCTSHRSPIPRADFPCGLNPKDFSLALLTTGLARLRSWGRTRRGNHVPCDRNFRHRQYHLDLSHCRRSSFGNWLCTQAFKQSTGGIIPRAPKPRLHPMYHRQLERHPSGVPGDGPWRWARGLGVPRPTTVQVKSLLGPPFNLPTCRFALPLRGNKPLHSSPSYAIWAFGPRRAAAL